MTQLQNFMPVIYLGTYSFLYGPNTIQFDQETIVALHNILGLQDQSEPVGYTLPKITTDGFLYSTTNQALLDMFKFSQALSNGAYLNRPVSIGMLTQDNSGSSSSQMWFSGVGYLPRIHFEYKGGRANYKYPFGFSWIEARQQILIATNTAIAQGTTAYTFTLTGQPNGFIAGVQLQGASIGTLSSVLQAIASVKDNASVTIGTGPSLGSAANQLFSGNPLLMDAASGPYFYMPVTDNSSNQSISRTAPTGTYTVNFVNSFATANLPSAINLVYIPL